jgi:hypothetical protein
MTTVLKIRLTNELGMLRVGVFQGFGLASLKALSHGKQVWRGRVGGVHIHILQILQIQYE